ncbi:MAG: hypothetical protein ABSC56_01445 [Solirubrobacteraceae bacterium]
MCIAGLLVSAPSAVASQDFFGLNLQPLVKMDSITSSDVLPESDWSSYIAGTMTAGGLTVARADAPWAWVEPNAPATPCGDTAADYDWNNTATSAGQGVPESLDDLVAALAENDVRFLPVIDTAPAWAAGGGGAQLAPAYYCDLANFAQALVQRYGPNGTFWQANPQLPYLPVEQYELWTEANSTNFWSGQYCGGYDANGNVDLTPIPACAQAYAAGLISVSEAIHGVDPNAAVLASIGWQNFLTYVPDLYDALASDGAPANTVNGIGFHPYGVDTQSILQLDEQLRFSLQSIATSQPTYATASLPIYDTEDGQAVVASGSGASYSWEGAVTDAARAAMLSLAGAALARSDCGVDDYLLYGITGSGTSLEPDDEGFMGLWSLDGETPDLTAQALVAAASDWAASPTGGIVLCGSGTTPSADLLPLGLTLQNNGAGCVSGTISYGGNPLEGAYLQIQSDGQTYSSGNYDLSNNPNNAYGSNAFGQAEVCIPSGSPPVTTFTVEAQGITWINSPEYYAQSVTWTCPESGGACSENVPVNNAVPTISGSAVVGDTLTEQQGTWSNFPTGYSYQWEDCSNGSCAAISGATGQTYVVQSSDLGDTIEVAETASNDGGSGIAVSSLPTGTVGDSSTGSSTPGGSTGSGGTGTTTTTSPSIASTSTPSSASTVAPPTLKLIYTLRAKILRAGKHATKLSAQLLLSAGTPASATLAVWLHKPGKHATKILLRDLTLAGANALKGKLGPLARGDEIVLVVAADNSLSRPLLVRTLKVR